MSEKIKLEIIEWLKAFGFAAVFGILVFIFARPSFVVGMSMNPTFLDGDMVLVERVSQTFSKPSRGDIVVAASHLKLNDHANKNLIKRVVGLPGEHIKIEDEKVFINGTELEETYTKDGVTNGFFEGTIPEDCVFLMGDNRLGSNDSRSVDVGYVPIKDLRGRVYLRLWPLNTIKLY